LVFISTGGEWHLTPAMMQGKVGNGELLAGHDSFGFLLHGGKGMWVWVLSGFVQVGGKREGEKRVEKSK